MRKKAYQKDFQTNKQKSQFRNRPVTISKKTTTSTAPFC